MMPTSLTLSEAGHAPGVADPRSAPRFDPGPFIGSGPPLTEPELFHAYRGARRWPAADVAELEAMDALEARALDGDR